jgi:hypothetical protein
MSRDWRDTLRTAADFALLGIAVCVVAVPVVTVGAAIATGSVAADHWCRYRTLPPLRELAGVFGRAVLPGIGATVVALAVAALLVLDVTQVGRGAVPGGTPLLVVSVVVAAQLAGLAALTVVGIGRLPRADGRRPGRWRAALGWAGRAAFASPLVPSALAVVLAVAVVLGVLVPITAPILVGFLLFALHVVARRMVDPARAPV